MKTATLEKRRYARRASVPRFDIDLLQAHAQVPTTSVNFSEGGLCFRLRQLIDVRSIVHLRLSPGGAARRSGASKRQAVECTGRVAWVTQRMDLSGAPPFFYDVGIEFVDPSPALRQLVAQSGIQLARRERPVKVPLAVIRGRRFLPRLEKDPGHAPSWHLIVMANESPCFSGRFMTKRDALAGWAKFKRQQARSRS